jgi:uncharacterized protein
MKFLKKAVYLFTAVYLILIVMAFAFQSRFIFHPGKLPPDYQFSLGENDREVFLKTSDEETINALFYRGPGNQVVLYFHGNAGDLSNWQSVSTEFLAAGYSLFVIDYRGYGKSSGVISEQGFYNDAEASWDYLTNTLNIIYGRSIGTGVAVQLATRCNGRGLVLESPYSSLRKLAQQKASWLLPALWLRFHFDSLKRMMLVKSPVIFIHGSSDTLIPPSHTQDLYEAFHGKKMMAIIRQGSHNDLQTFDEYTNIISVQMREFFE